MRHCVGEWADLARAVEAEDGGSQREQPSENLHGITGGIAGCGRDSNPRDLRRRSLARQRRTAMIMTSPAPEVMATAVVQGDGAESSSSSSHQGDTILGKTALWQA